MNQQATGLSDHFTYRKLLRYTFPSILMLVISSIYYVVDGIFVSNFVGKLPFAALNFVYPVLSVLSALGFMFGSGGSALIAKTMGERKPQRANQIFTVLMYISVLSGVLLGVLGALLLRPIEEFLGAEGQLLEDGLIYGRICMAGIPASMLQFEFQYLCVTANKPKFGMYVTVGAGIANIVLDALFIVVFRWGLVGAAAASVASQCVGGFLPLLYFCRKNTSLLRMVKTRFEVKPILKICSNGASELLTNVSVALVSMLYNAQFLSYIGEDGVAAYGVLMYVNFVFLAIFIGYVVGVSPLISFHYGAQNHGEMKNLLHKSMVIVGITSLLMFLAGELMARPLCQLYVAYDRELFDITLRGFFLYSFSFLFSGLAIFGPSFFTALNNGLISAVISFLRMVVFQMGTVLILPLIWDIDGIWISVAVAEFLAALTTVIFIAANQKKYHY